MKIDSCFKQVIYSHYQSTQLATMVGISGGRSRSKRHRADNIDIEERLEKLILKVGDKVDENIYISFQIGQYDYLACT